MWPKDLEEMLTQWQRTFPLVLLKSIVAVYDGIAIETTCHTRFLWVRSEKTFKDVTNWKKHSQEK